jgi:hypothetical protein
MLFVRPFVSLVIASISAIVLRAAIVEALSRLGFDPHRNQTWLTLDLKMGIREQRPSIR